MTAPLVSCIIPVYNGERYLSEALDSVLTQSYRPVEVIVVDDGSTDNTPGVVASFGDRARCLRQCRAGQATARNLGIGASRGDFVSFLDADDLWHPEKLDRQMARFAARPELDYCVTHVQNFWDPELQEEADSYQGHPRGRPLPGYVTGTLLARRALFETLGGFDPSLNHADKTEWFLRAATQGAVRELLPEVLMFRRMHSGNRTRALGSNSRDEYLQLLKAALDRRRGAAG